MTKIVPIFYACDEGFIPFTLVSIKSLVENSSPDFRYEIHVLNTGIPEESKKLFAPLEKYNISISFDDVSQSVKLFQNELPVRDYYTNTTYFRFLIAQNYPQYDKAVYLDSDTVVLGDVAELWQTDLKDNWIAAANDALVPQSEEFSAYVENALGIYRYAYFNAGVMVISCEKFREYNILKKFLTLLAEVDFTVAQDQDYLNVICRDRVTYLEREWNVEASAQYPENICPKLVHYNMTAKPWHYSDCAYSEEFRRYVDMLPIRDVIKGYVDSYSDEQRLKDGEVMKGLAALAQKEADDPNSFWQRELQKRDVERVQILQKMSELEHDGKFDVDVENDPPTLPLTGNVDYMRKKLKSKINRNIAFALARSYVRKLIKNNQLIVKVDGLENLRNLSCSAVVTCNHIHPFDSFVIQCAFMQAKKKKRIFRIIREGNYTSFPGFYGYLMRNCDTLPLSSSLSTMKQFSHSVDKLLANGQLILIYPEQSMWWNYRKPRPLKKGAFKIAARNHVPVLPLFITMRDSEFVGEDGFPVQEYTIHIGSLISADKRGGNNDTAAFLCAQNNAFWKDIYESVYGMPLHYDELRKAE